MAEEVESIQENVAALSQDSFNTLHINKKHYGWEFQLVYPGLTPSEDTTTTDIVGIDNLNQLLNRPDLPWSYDLFCRTLRQLNNAHVRVRSIAGLDPTPPRVRVVSSPGNPAVLFDAVHNNYVINLAEPISHPDLVWHEAGHELSMLARGGPDDPRIQVLNREGRSTAVQGPPKEILFAIQCFEKNTHPYFEGFSLPNGVTNQWEEDRNIYFLFAVEEIVAHRTAAVLLGQERYGAVAKKTIETFIPQLMEAAQQEQIDVDEIIYVATYLPVLKESGQLDTARSLKETLDGIIYERGSSVGISEKQLDQLSGDLTEYYDRLVPKFS